MSAKKENVLIIESNVELANKLMNALNMAGYSASTVTHGSNVPESIQDIAPKLIILDPVLHDSDAYDILRTISSDSKLSKIGVFLLSTQGSTIDMHRVPDNSVAEFIISLDLDLDDLIKRVNNFFGRTDNDNSEKSMDKKTILWVEDDKLIGSILEKKFTAAGLGLYHAQTGDAAIEYLKNNTPDAIILDLMLPGMDGFEILQKARMDKRTSKTPAMILSNLSKPGDLEKAKMLGASKYMIKASSSLDQIVAEAKKLI